MATIKQLRSEIDKIDTVIIKKLSQRNKLCKKIGLLKKDLKKKVVDTDRELKLMNNYEKLSAQYSLPPAFVKRLFKIIIMNSRRLQK